MLAWFKTLRRSWRIIVQSKKEKEMKKCCFEKVSLGLTNKNIPVKRARLPGFSWFRVSLFYGAGSQPIRTSRLPLSVFWRPPPPEAPVSAFQLQLPLTHFTFPSMAAGSFCIERRTAGSCTASRTVMGGDCTEYYGLFYSSEKQSSKKKTTNDTN